MQMPVGVFGMCPCGGLYEERRIEVTFGGDDPAQILTDIPQGVCPSCGGQVYKAETLERVEASFRTSRPRPEAAQAQRN
jgi:YgiT-type zinc finger domain-containing protein